MGPIKAIPSGWTSWDSIVIKGPLTLGNFIGFFKNTYGVELTIISWG